MVGAQPRRAARSRSWLSAVRWLAAAGLAALAIAVLIGRQGELTGTMASFRHLRAPWVAAAVLAELASTALYAQMLGRLLREAGHRFGSRELITIGLASNAVANSLPAGPAFGAGYLFRQLRHRAVPALPAAWVMVGSGVLASAGLAALAAVGVGASFGQSRNLGLAGVILPSAGIAAALVVLLRHPGLLGRRLQRRLAGVRPSWSGLLVGLGWSLGNWAFDLACLVAAFAAVGAAVPWRGLVLSYGAAQLAANLPVTPGGLGVVEGSLTIGLVAYGGDRASSVAAVLMYRILSFWLMLLLGWAAAAGLAVDARRSAP